MDKKIVIIYIYTNCIWNPGRYALVILVSSEGPMVQHPVEDDWSGLVLVDVGELGEGEEA